MSTILEGRTAGWRQEGGMERWMDDCAENARPIRERMKCGRRGLTVSGLIEGRREGGEMVER